MSAARETYTEQWLRRFSADAMLFSDMSLHELGHVYEALTLAIGAIEGKFHVVGTETVAHHYIERLAEALSDRRNVLVESLHLRPDPCDREEVEQYAMIKARYLAEGGAEAENVEEFAADIAERYARLSAKGE